VLVLGSVPYANGRPLLEGLADGPGVRLVLDRPSGLARRLAAGELDAALLPSVEWFRDPRLVLVPEGCIASRGAVASVSLFHREPLRPGMRVALDASSRTSAALVRLLLAGPLGAPGATYAECPPETDPRTAEADAVLLIGDAALVLDRRGLLETDLGEAWTRWTGLPFVWAVWAARDGRIASEAAPLLREARARGRERLAGIAREEAARLGLAPGLLERYLAVHIRHDLGEEERRGLERFREEWGREGREGPAGGRAPPGP
jgi:chorismate dehydratase